MGWSPRGSSCDADVDQGREGRYDGDGDESRYRTDAVRASRKRVRRLRRSKLARAPIADEEESTSAVEEREREMESKAREKARVWFGPENAHRTRRDRTEPSQPAGGRHWTPQPPSHIPLLALQRVQGDS